MKIIETEHKVNMTDNLREFVRGFSIEMSSKMANMLSDKVYSNKILAVIRELSTNAFDSHVDNGNADLPFEVGVPTYTHPTFWIRDFGTGMSPEKIWNLYTVYGKSDRENSNDFVGSYGIGSKAFFCYHTKSATIESWWQGRKYAYQCFLDSNNIPSITKLYDVESNEPSGVKVSFETNRSDYLTFANTMKSFYKYFSVKPTFIGSSVEVENEKYLIIGNGWGIKKSGDCQAIMGNVAYKIDPYQFTTEENGYLFSCPIDLFFDIGELNTELGREGLSYDLRTKEHIKWRIKNLVEECWKNVESQMAQCKNVWEAKCLRNRLCSMSEGLFRSFNWSALRYNGQEIFDDWRGLQEHVNLSKFVENKQLVVYKFEPRKYRRNGHATVKNLPISDSIVLYENDLKHGAISRVKEKAQELSHTIYVLQFLDSSIRQDIIKYIGFDETYLFNKTSFLPKAQSNHTNTFNRKKTKVIQFHSGFFHKNKNEYWADTNISLSLDGYYVPTLRYDFMYNGKYYEPNFLSKLCLAYSSIGETLPTIYGIKESDVKTLSKNWKNFAEIAVDKITNYLYTHNEQQLLSDEEEMKSVCGYSYESHTMSLDVLKLIGKHLSQDHYINYFISILNTTQKGQEFLVKIKEINKIVNSLHIPRKSDSVVKKGLFDIKKKIYQTYLMLYYVQSNKSGISKVVDYIQFVDSCIKGEN